ncbi:MAG: FtsX-like permease family protein [Polyangiaceae bacterium]|nr:FtsX-like permease family protein [Polyangiaceae bacterium]
MILGRVWSSFFLALRAVRRNKLRAGLTTLGIMIGVAAVVTVTSLASSARTGMMEQVSALGSNALMVFPRSSKASGARDGTGSKLNELDAKALVRESTSIASAAPFLRASTTAVYEGNNATTSVIGTRIDYFAIRNWKAKSGDLWPTTAESVGDKVVLIGVETARKLFGSIDPVGRSIRIGRFYFQVLGVLEEKGQSPFGQNQDEVIVMPITTMRSTIVRARPNETHAIMFSATSADTSGQAKRQAELILRDRHKISEGEDDDFQVYSQNEFQKLQDTIFGFLTMLLVGVAAVSLLVGGIGVMNIMLVSVAERTREIGIRMAIGAREADILVQFLVEALVLAMIGGLLGTLLGYGLIAAFSAALKWKMSLDMATLVLALGVSSAIGLIFGFLPARRAAQLDPIKALGRE